MSDRSQRRREATLAEIKAVARQQLIRSGPAAISLRAIARDMGMTAPALYRYYPSLDSLVLDLCTDLYTELRLACERARDEVPIKDLVKRLQEMAREFRRWVLAHPPEAALMFGPPLPGVEKFIEHCGELQDAGEQFGQIFREPLAQLGAEGSFLNAWTRLYGVVIAQAFGHLNWADIDPDVLFEAELADMTESLVSKEGRLRAYDR